MSPSWKWSASIQVTLAALERAASWLFIGALSMGVGFARCEVDSQPGDEVEAPRIVGLELVLRELEAGRSLDSQALVNALLMAGPRGQSELWRALHAGRVSSDASLDGAIDKALRGIPSWVAERATREVASPRRYGLEVGIALRVLSEFGTAKDLHTLTTLATPSELESALEPKVATQFSETLAHLLRRDASTYESLERVFAGLDARLQRAVLLGVGSVTSRDSLRFLSGLLEFDSDLALIVLGQVGRVGHCLGLPPDERTHTFLLMSLSATDPAVRREASITVGRMEDSEAVPDLIELLADDEASVALNAHWALEQITGKHLAAELGLWARWYDKELLWWRTRAADALADMHGTDPGTISKAIREVSSHRLYRHDLARELLPLLGTEHEAIASQACAALAILNSRVAEDALRELVEHGPESVRPHARRALESLLDSRPAR